ALDLPPVEPNHPEEGQQCADQVEGVGGHPQRIACPLGAEESAHRVQNDHEQRNGHAAEQEGGPTPAYEPLGLQSATSVLVRLYSGYPAAARRLSPIISSGAPLRAVDAASACV